METNSKKHLTNDNIRVIIRERENTLLEELRKIGYGRVTIFIENGQPVRIEEALKSVKL